MKNRLTENSLGALRTEHAQVNNGEFEVVLTDSQQHMIDFSVLTDTTKYLKNVLPDSAMREVHKKEQQHSRKQLERLFSSRSDYSLN